MNDQASRLRQIVAGFKKNAEQETDWSDEARVITITSGKGGVGKTNFTVNLAIALAKLGKQVLVIDADFGLANVDVILGQTSKYDLSHVISGQKSISDIVETGPCGIKFISGGSGIYDLIKMGASELGSIVEGITSLATAVDFVLLDTGAGINDSILELVSSSHEVLLIATPEPTSIMDAYALVKTVLKENGEVKIKLVVNRAESRSEGEDMLDKFRNVVMHYLGVRIVKLGYILYDQAMVMAVKKQTPLMVYSPKSVSASNIERIARLLLDDYPSYTNNEGGIRGFFRRLLSNGLSR